MPDLLGAANPVPGYDRSVTNRNVPVSSENSIQLQNVPDTNRISRADGKTERQDNNLQNGDRIRYDSNFQTFLQRLKETPSMSESLRTIFAGKEGTVVLSGMKDGVAQEMAKILTMLRMDEKQLLEFLNGQVKLGTRFNGGLFALLRNAYARAGSDALQLNILQFLKNYADYSSTQHIENSILQNLRRMADSMPARWAEQLREMLAQLENNMAAGDRTGSLSLLEKNIFPYMSRYVSQTHDMGLPRQLLAMLALDVARYESGSEEKLLEQFHQLRGFGTLQNLLGGIDDQALLQLLQNARNGADSSALQFSNALISAAARALSGEGSLEVQQGFQNLVAAMLVNESVYMPINHYLLPLEWDGRVLFSELWVDPDAEEGKREANEKNTMRFLLKLDVQDVGLFDIILTSQNKNVDVHISCPDAVVPHGKQIETAVTEILKRNDLTPARVLVRRMEKPVALTEVFPKIFDGRNGINVKA